VPGLVRPNPNLWRYGRERIQSTPLCKFARGLPSYSFKLLAGNAVPRSVPPGGKASDVLFYRPFRSAKPAEFFDQSANQLTEGISNWH
jgi:hypothetical protein